MKKDPNIVILTVTHKDFDDSALPEGYKVIKVGTALSTPFANNRGWLSDDTGDNIAERNPYYCELTACYWAWKNLKNIDYIGISHYRRYFMNYKSDAETFWENLITVDKCRKIFKHYKAIMPFYEKKVREWSKDSKTPENADWSILRDIIFRDYPEMRSSYDKIRRGPVLTYANMCILSFHDFLCYSSFLFDVLKKYDSEVKARNIPYLPRVDGYLSETILPIWISSRFKESEIYRTDVMNSEQTGWTRKTLLGKLRVFHSVLCLVRKFQLFKTIHYEKWFRGHFNFKLDND